MKPQNLITQMAALIAFSYLAVGCSGGGNGFTNTAATSNVAVGGSGSTTTPGGSTSTPSTVAPNAVGVPVTMTLASDSAINTYSLGGTASGAQVSNLQIGVSLSNYNSAATGGAYGGTVSVSYYANGYWHTGIFQALNATTPGSVWDGSSKNVQNLNHAAYNRWFSYGGQTVFHGFYADPYGAIMLVITGGLDLGDGNGISSLNGEIWFKNYYSSAAAYNYPNPNGTPCWFLSLGQYECRTFLVNGDSGYGNLVTTSALTPDQSQYTQNKNIYVPATPARGWQKLGTFTGLNRIQGFGQ